MIRRGALLAALCCFGLLSHAHESRPLYFELTERDAGRYELQWRYPESIRLQQIPLAVVQSCDPSSKHSAATRSGLRVVDCGVAPTALQLAFAEGNPSLSAVVRFERRGYAPWVLQVPPGETRIQLPEAVADGQWWSGYLELGMRHIAGGVDHLLFLLCLILLVQEVRRLLVVITGFTLAHSITLGLSALGVVVLPVPWIEALIALSIVALAAELVTDPEHSWGRRFPLGLSSVFGLLHGLGFAAALRDMGLPTSEQLTSLLAFNIGVEIGQILFVLLALALLWLWRQVLNLPDLWSGFFPRVVGVVAGFWFFQRLIIGMS